MSKSVKKVNEQCVGRYGGVLPSTVRSLSMAYIADYDRRRLIVARGESRGHDEPRFRRINRVVDSAIASVLDMYGISGEAAEVIEKDLKSGTGSRSAHAVSQVGSFLSRKYYVQIRDDVLWFVARGLNLL